MTRRTTCSRRGISIALTTCSGDPCWVIGATHDPHDVWVAVLDHTVERTDEDACVMLDAYLATGNVP